MTFDKDSSAGYLVNHMARLFAKGLQDRIAPLGIVIGQFPILLELWEKDGVSQRDLLVRLDIEQATLANTLNRMERDGLIKRTKDEADARVQKIWLTAKAVEIKAQAYQSANDQNAVALADLDAAERELFLSLTRRVIGAMRSD
ncbi:MarR family transcriptional regulator [Amylibacter sp. IMCC11727]|uniref:MarR family winged helix-turn-helix transcriptional regulator n=1 Tax=Amylibacter sp. IMCC11727 TaxID=3039851 RepID=UPI00244E56D9|nr:MarR family transcriptional regulator [Amylibacter sp. IMCC11727]WGI21324.1 MarR family transcriptional regulator [Amylibacter sp. IMCC11727]